VVRASGRCDPPGLPTEGLREANEIAVDSRRPARPRRSRVAPVPLLSYDRNGCRRVISISGPHSRVDRRSCRGSSWSAPGDRRRRLPVTTRVAPASSARRPRESRHVDPRSKRYSIWLFRIRIRNRTIRGAARLVGSDRPSLPVGCPPVRPSADRLLDGPRVPRDARIRRRNVLCYRTASDSTVPWPRDCPRSPRPGPGSLPGVVPRPPPCGRRCDRRGRDRSDGRFDRSSASNSGFSAVSQYRSTRAVEEPRRREVGPHLSDLILLSNSNICLYSPSSRPTGVVAARRTARRESTTASAPVRGRVTVPSAGRRSPVGGSPTGLSRPSRPPAGRSRTGPLRRPRSRARRRRVRPRGPGSRGPSSRRG